jgi:hypothetical protein
MNADKMREKQRIADLKKQGIDPDADKVDEKPKKEYDTSFLKKYQLDEEEEETKDSPVEKTVD